MASKLVAILLVLLICRGVPDLVRLRDFSWWREWLEKLDHSSNAAIFVFGIGVPVLVCAILQYALSSLLFGLAAVAFAVVVLYLCWGPRDLERDAEAIDKAPDSVQRLAAAQNLRSEAQTAELAVEPQALVAATFTAALKRWFGVLFWFVLLGPTGAVLYRLTQMLTFIPGQPASPLMLRAAKITDWAPAQLMALALALASNFDAVFKTWRDYHHAHPQGYASLDPGFLDAIARASVAADAAADGHDAQSPLTALDDAMVLVRRVLVVWLTLIALLVLGGWFG